MAYLYTEVLPEERPAAAATLKGFSVYSSQSLLLEKFFRYFGIIAQQIETVTGGKIYRVHDYYWIRLRLLPNGIRYIDTPRKRYLFSTTDPDPNLHIGIWLEI